MIWVLKRYWWKSIVKRALTGVCVLQVRVLYDFHAQPGSGEMTLKEGEILSVTRQDVGDGWWEGNNAQGEAGLFPAAYTEVSHEAA